MHVVLFLEVAVQNIKNISVLLYALWESGALRNWVPRKKNSVAHNELTHYTSIRKSSRLWTLNNPESYWLRVLFPGVSPPRVLQKVKPKICWNFDISSFIFRRTDGYLLILHITSSVIGMWLIIYPIGGGKCLIRDSLLTNDIPVFWLEGKSITSRTRKLSILHRISPTVQGQIHLNQLSTINITPHGTLYFVNSTLPRACRSSPRMHWAY